MLCLRSGNSMKHSISIVTYIGFIPASNILVVRKNMPRIWLQVQVCGVTTLTSTSQVYEASYLVTSPVSFVKSWSPVRPTATCIKHSVIAVVQPEIDIKASNMMKNALRMNIYTSKHPQQSSFQNNFQISVLSGQQVRDPESTL